MWWCSCVQVFPNTHCTVSAGWQEEPEISHLTGDTYVNYMPTCHQCSGIQQQASSSLVACISSIDGSCRRRLAGSSWQLTPLSSYMPLHWRYPATGHQCSGSLYHGSMVSAVPQEAADRPLPMYSHRPPVESSIHVSRKQATFPCWQLTPPL